MAIAILKAKRSIKRKKNKDWVQKRLKYIVQLKNDKVYIYTLNKNLLDVKIQPNQIGKYFDLKKYINK